jgi:hypothetical protein
MTDITISLEDLETLVMAAGAIKTIETALDTRKRDPFVPPQNQIAAAVGRLAAEARSARRSKETYQTPWDGELDEQEIKWLDMVCKDYDPTDRAKRMFLITPDERFKSSAIGRLTAKGMLLIGNSVKGVIWPGADQPEFAPDPTCYYLMPTPRGLRKWRELKAVNSSKEEPKP